MNVYIDLCGEPILALKVHQVQTHARSKYAVRELKARLEEVASEMCLNDGLESVVDYEVQLLFPDQIYDAVADFPEWNTYTKEEGAWSSYFRKRYTGKQYPEFWFSKLLCQ